jgi:hypothetical protein
MEKKNDWIKIANKPGEIIFPVNNIAYIAVE